MALGSGYNWQNLYAGIDANRDQQNRFLQAEEREKARQLAQSNTDRQFGLRERQFKFTQDQAEADRLWREKQFGSNQAYRNATLGIAQAGERRAQTKFDLDRKNQLATRFAGIANAVNSAPPEQRAALWGRMIQRFPQLAASLKSAGVDPANVAMGTQFLIAQAGSVGGSQAKSGIPFQDSTTGQWHLAQPRDSGPPAVYPLAGAPAPHDPNLKARIAGASTTAKVNAETVAKARSALPQIQTDTRQAMLVLDKILKHPRLDAVTGNTGYLPSVRGSTRGLDALIKQAQGGAYRQAVAAFRGLGALSDNEGKAALAAITRLGQGPMSKEDTIEAIKELQTYYRSGLRNAERLARGLPPIYVTPDGSNPEPSSGGFKYLGRAE